MTATPPADSFHRYRPDIDGLRAVAVLAVIAFHAFPGLVRGGFSGVDVFFVISGYLISGLLLQDLHDGSFSFAGFYARRVRRIFPALIVVLAACCLYGWFTLLNDELRQLSKHVAASALFISNFVLWHEAGYFDNASLTKPLLHLWSLGIEEQFYIVWPLLLWLARGRNVATVVCIAVVAVVSFALNVAGMADYAVATFFSPLTRFWELACGGLLAWLHLRPTAFNVDARTASAASLLGATLLIAGFVGLDEAHFPGLPALVPVVGAVLLIGAGSTAWVNRTLLARTPCVWIGKISYPLYLWHWPLLSFARIVGGSVPGIVLRSFIVAASIVLAWLTWRCIEQPIRVGAPTPRKLATLAGLMILLGSLGATLHANYGMGLRPLVHDGNASAFDLPASQIADAGCIALLQPRHIRLCHLSRANPPTVALIGDSHAMALFDYVDRYFAARKRGVVLLGEEGCPPFLGVERDQVNCAATMRNAVEFVASQPQIREVYLTGRFAAAETGIDYGAETAPGFFHMHLQGDAGVTDRDAIFAAGLAAMLERLAQANKQVTVILDLPELDFDPRSCLRQSLRECALDRTVVEQRQAGYRALIAGLQQRYRFRTVDLLDAFCDSTRCVARADGKILYLDSHHLGVQGADYLLARGFRLD
ncbi:MAG TPA: acyltransferase family protein [Candidatus Acidoferrum sp.]|nr:acyltransferase family protein [Candidatus Acidoferrum sp.]